MVRFHYFVRHCVCLKMKENNAWILQICFIWLVDQSISSCHVGLNTCILLSWCYRSWRGGGIRGTLRWYSIGPNRPCYVVMVNTKFKPLKALLIYSRWATSRAFSAGSEKLRKGPICCADSEHGTREVTVYALSWPR